MTDAAEPYDVLVRWPEKNGHWYFACVNPTFIDLKNPIHPDEKYRTIPQNIAQSNIRYYSQVFREKDLKSAPSTEPLQKGDHVLARARFRHQAKEGDTYEMGHVRSIQSENNVVVDFEDGGMEVVEYDRICHMYQGGPTRLNHAACAIYPRLTSPEGERRFSVSTIAEKMLSLPSVPADTTGESSRRAEAINAAQPQSGFISTGLESSSTSFKGFYDVEHLTSALQNHLGDPNYVVRSSLERKNEIIDYSGQFFSLPWYVRESQEGQRFKRTWVQLVEHHNYYLAGSASTRISHFMNEDWYGL